MVDTNIRISVEYIQRNFFGVSLNFNIRINKNSLEEIQ